MPHNYSWPLVVINQILLLTAEHAIIIGKTSKSNRHKNSHKQILVLPGNKAAHIARKIYLQG